MKELQTYQEQLRSIQELEAMSGWFADYKVRRFYTSPDVFREVPGWDNVYTMLPGYLEEIRKNTGYFGKINIVDIGAGPMPLSTIFAQKKYASLYSLQLNDLGYSFSWPVLSTIHECLLIHQFYDKPKNSSEIDTYLRNQTIKKMLFQKKKQELILVGDNDSDFIVEAENTPEYQRLVSEEDAIDAVLVSQGLELLKNTQIDIQFFYGDFRRICIEPESIVIMSSILNYLDLTTIADFISRNKKNMRAIAIINIVNGGRRSHKNVFKTENTRLFTDTNEILLQEGFTKFHQEKMSNYKSKNETDFFIAVNPD